MTIEGF